MVLRDGDIYSASVIPMEVGLQGEPARVSADPNGVFDLLEGIGSVKLVRQGRKATF